MGSLGGQVYIDNQPLPDALVSFFNTEKGLPPIAAGFGRVPDFLGRTDSDGKFQIKLLAGSYYMGILVRDSRESIGPPRPGEKFYFADDGGSRLREFTVADFKQLDIGRINGSSPEIFKNKEDFFTIEGVLLKEKSYDPYTGASVLAKSKLNQLRPEFISKPSDEEGHFSLNLPAGKTFYLVARHRITGVKPDPGEKIGTYGIDSAEGVAAAGMPMAATAEAPPGVIEKAEIKSTGSAIPVNGEVGEVISGIKIHMYDVPDRQEVQETIKEQIGAPMFEAGASINNIFFAFNSHKLDYRSFSELDKWAKFLIERFDIKIELYGHTDNVGDELYNLQLSERRARSVAEYLVAQGVDSARISVIGFGLSKPLATNKTEEGQSRNRRVEVRFFE